MTLDYETAIDVAASLLAALDAVEDMADKLDAAVAEVEIPLGGLAQDCASGLRG